MITTVTPPKVAVRRAGRTEPLENGDRLTGPEFLRRYEAMPQVKKAELIEGVVYIGSPVRTDVHAEPDNLIQILNIPALLDQNGAGVFANLHAGLRSQAHRKFALKLAASNGPVARGEGRTKPGD